MVTPNTAKFPDIDSLIPEGKNQNDVALYISDYYINSILNVAYYRGLVGVNVPYIDIDTTILDAALLNQLSEHGYEKDMPCKTMIYAYGEPPQLSLSEKQGVQFTSQLGIDFKCKKTK
jgi:hypothetical protein